jgi:predicted O-methyltransferase YrrM
MIYNSLIDNKKKRLYTRTDQDPIVAIYSLARGEWQMSKPWIPARKYTHGDLIEILVTEYRQNFPEQPVFVETGCGISTLRLARIGNDFGATIFSCDINQEKIAELKRRAGSRFDNVRFMTGDSLASLKAIASEYPQVDFLFLDAAASAMHTFLEFAYSGPS